MQADAYKRGYDGVIIKNVIDSASWYASIDPSTVLIAFSPEQIKSISNLNPTSDPDMRYHDREAYTDEALTSPDSDGGIFGYEFLINRPDMQITNLPSTEDILVNGVVERANIVRLGREDALAQGGSLTSAGHIAIRNDYTGRVINITNQSIRHGLAEDNAPGKRPARLYFNSKAGSVIGQIVKHGIPINGLISTGNNVDGTYALAAYASEPDGRSYAAIVHVDIKTGETTKIDVVDVAHSVNTRITKEAVPVNARQSLPKRPELFTASTISIRDFLDVVNGTFQSVLSKDVLQALHGSTESDGYYSDRALHQERDADLLTKRQMLANAFTSIARTDGEKRNLREYKNLIGTVNRFEQEAKDLRLQNTAERRKKADGDKALIEKNKERIAQLEERISAADKRLLRLQNAAPLKALLKREGVRMQAEAVDKARAAQRERMVDYRDRMEGKVQERMNEKCHSHAVREWHFHVRMATEAVFTGAFPRRSESSFRRYPPAWRPPETAAQAGP